jgi:hypothetical protein
MIRFHRALLRCALAILISGLMAQATASAQTPGTGGTGQKSATRQVTPKPVAPAAPRPAPVVQPAPVVKPAAKSVAPAPSAPVAPKTDAVTKPAAPEEKPAATEEKPASSADKPTAPEEKPATPQTEEPIEVDGKYLLRYKFEKGEIIRWEVEHKAEVRTTVAGTTQTAETTTVSVKAWKVARVEADGSTKFIHMVDRVDMRNKLTGRQEVRYNSLTDEKPPEGFEQMAKGVGVPLTLVLIDSKGTVLQREELISEPNSRTGQIVVPLPADRVAVGDVWNIPKEVAVTLKDKSVKQVKTRQRFNLQGVKNGIATLEVESQILSPIHDPQLEAQLIQYDFNGTIKFDLEAGRIVAQQCDLDKRVHGFQGDASTMHYVTRFVEKLLPANINTAKRPVPVAGPQQ